MHLKTEEEIPQFTAQESDEELAGRMKHGDEFALEKILRRHTPLLHTIAMRVLHNECETEEVLNEAAMEIWLGIQAYQEEKGKFLGWLVTLVRRRSIDRVRRRQAYSRMQEGFRIEHDVDAVKVCPIGQRGSELLMNGDIYDRLLQLMRSKFIPAAQQECLREHLAGMSQRQMAAKLCVPLGTIKTRLELAMKKLRRLVRADPAFEVLPW